MKKTIILLAGYPATGKSYLCNKICSRYPEFHILSQDELKEKLWDQYGFNNMEEKTALEMKSWECYYEQMDQRMKRESSLSRIIRSVTSKKAGYSP